MKVIAYRRVSTASQTQSGLGMEAQQSYIGHAVKANEWELIGAFEDAGLSGGLAPHLRPGLKAAIELAKKEGAALLVAKIDRLSRSVADTAQVMEAVEIKVATMPHANNFQLHLFAALAEQEKEFIQQRTREALAALQARADAGEEVATAKIARRNAVIGTVATAATRQKGADAMKTGADAFAKAIRAHILEAQHDGATTLQQIADALNGKGVSTRRGAKWEAISVSRVMKRIGL
ncbi:recombinase family protein [Citrobacter freundii]|uniref:recombinase family protein n=1 Tax=Citrobacter freundii TaxID=546 RepID=UPI0028EA2B72|nr:recombinase family protein [Citrobacter freundii]WNT10007.1 recombinase family protein [Citrobacter freundii]HCL6023503.1 recombinase family protein [Citrobacter freundii]